MKLTRTIAFRLFLLIASLQTVILVVLTYATITIQQSNLMDHVRISALRLSDVIARSARHSMMLNRKEDVHEIISSVGREPGIEGIRLYNNVGEVIFGTSPEDIKTRVDMDAEACVSCHRRDGKAPLLGNGEQLTRTLTMPGGGRALGLITHIRNEPECASAACHAHPADRPILGVLDVKMSLAQVDHRLEEHKATLIILSVIATLAVALLSWAFIWLFVRRPVKQLMVGMEEVASGRLDHRVRARTNDELGQLARRFNQMTEDLAAARKELTEWSRTLEAKVNEKTRDLESAHKHMARVEKMASLGNLASSVAHELNNPMEGILTFARLLIKRLKKTALPPEELHACVADLTLVADEAQRCGDIVRNLLVFARHKGGAFQPAHIGPIVDRCLRLLRHHAELRSVVIRGTVAADDLLECDPNQIEQVLIAVVMNAIESMVPEPDGSSRGLLTVDAAPSDEVMVLRVSDAGMGMSEETKARLFEPFFSTKSEGKGVGLGLAIAYGIIQIHHGNIEVDSVPGQGSVFTITLPLRQPISGQQVSAATMTQGTGV